MKIVIVGSAHPYRGGLASFSERLASEFVAEGHDVEIVTFTLQYPSFLFPGKTQFTDSPKPQLDIVRRINSTNPFNWMKVGREIRDKNADMVISVTGCRLWHQVSVKSPALSAETARRNVLHWFII